MFIRKCVTLRVVPTLRGTHRSACLGSADGEAAGSYQGFHLIHPLMFPCRKGAGVQPDHAPGPTQESQAVTLVC